MVGSMTTAEAVERLARDKPRYVPALRAVIAVAQDFNVANLGTFTARDVRRKLPDWGDGPADYMPRSGASPMGYRWCPIVGSGLQDNEESEQSYSASSFSLMKVPSFSKRCP